MIKLNKKLVLIIDPSSPYVNKILTVYQDIPYHGSDELVWIIEYSGYDWFWEAEFIEGQLYIEITERIKKLLALL